MFFGSKIQGGAAGVAVLIARQEGANRVTADHVERACKLIKQTGFSAGVHDMRDRDLHCGRVDRGMKGELSDPAWQVTPGEIAKMVIDQGGKHVALSDTHQERSVWINFIENTTRVPNDRDQVFQLDAWYVNWIGLNLMGVLMDAVQTVEAISNVRQAVVWE